MGKCVVCTRLLSAKRQLSPWPLSCWDTNPLLWIPLPNCWILYLLQRNQRNRAQQPSKGFPFWVKIKNEFIWGKVCIIRLVHIFFLNLRGLFDKYAVVRTEQDALVKSTTKIFSNFVAFSENPNFNQNHKDAQWKLQTCLQAILITSSKKFSNRLMTHNTP